MAHDCSCRPDHEEEYEFILKVKIHHFHPAGSTCYQDRDSVRKQLQNAIRRDGDTDSNDWSWHIESAELVEAEKS